MDPNNIRAAFLEKFRQVTCERIATITDLFSRLKDAPNDQATAEDLMRGLHSLKGEARMMGFGEVGRLLHAIEDVMKVHRDRNFTDLAQIAELFQDSLDGVMTLVMQDGGETSAEALQQRIRTCLEEHAQKTPMDEPATIAQEKTSSKAEKPATRPKRKKEKATANPPKSEQQPAPAESPGEPGKPPRRADSTRLDVDKPAQVQPAAAPVAPRYSLANMVRVSGRDLDLLNNMIGDLFSAYLSANDLRSDLNDLSDTARKMSVDMLRCLSQQLSLHSHEETLPDRAQDLNRRLSSLRQRFQERLSGMATVLNQLLNQVSEIRLLPVSTLFSLYRTAARDIARVTDKSVDVFLEGESTRVDRSILDALGDSMLHLVRNAIDHGIESPAVRGKSGKTMRGKLNLRARTTNDRIQIDVEDDGRGIDPERIRQIALAKGLLTEVQAQKLDERECMDLIFRPGFTTTTQTSEVSGRGIGMDVVRTKLQELGGSVQVWSTPGVGTRFTLELPTSIAIARVLLFRSGGQVFALLASFVHRVERIKSEDLTVTPDHRAMVLEERTIAAADSAELLGLGQSRSVSNRIPIVIVEHAGRLLALQVDELLGERELTIKPFSPFLASIRAISGAAVMDDGTLVLLLSPSELVSGAARRMGLRSSVRLQGPIAQARPRVLLVEDSIITRELERSVLHSFNLDVEEAGDGLDALQKLGMQKFDVIVSDVEMPQLDGLELTRRVKSDERYQHIPVILVTTLGGVQVKKRGLQAGADAYVVKNEFGSQSFYDILRRFLPLERRE